MDQQLKESVGTLLAHIIKVDNRNIEKETPLFCKIMGEQFACDPAEASEFLEEMMEKEYDLDQHVTHINQALSEDKLSKYHILEALNHMIYSDKITPEDYKMFEDIKNKLFVC